MKIQVLKDGPIVEVDVTNSFCPTGKGGGVDPSCGSGKGGGGKGASTKPKSSKKAKSQIATEYKEAQKELTRTHADFVQADVWGIKDGNKVGWVGQETAKTNYDKAVARWQSAEKKLKATHSEKEIHKIKYGS